MILCTETWPKLQISKILYYVLRLLFSFVSSKFAVSGYSECIAIELYDFFMLIDSQLSFNKCDQYTVQKKSFRGSGMIEAVGIINLVRNLFSEY